MSIDARVQQGLPQVRKIAALLLKSLPSFVRIDDLTAAGHDGLLDAARRYDPGRNASFSSFAYYRIRGAMLDYYRREAAASPYARARAASLAAVDDLAESRLADAAPTHAPASPEAVADAAASLARLLDDATLAFGMAELAEGVTSEGVEDPDESLQRKQLRARLSAMMRALPKRERGILEGVYVRGLTIEEAGKQQKLTKSWASRLHARALELARAALDPERDALMPEE